MNIPYNRCQFIAPGRTGRIAAVDRQEQRRLRIDGSGDAPSRGIRCLRLRTAGTSALSSACSIWYDLHANLSKFGGLEGFPAQIPRSSREGMTHSSVLGCSATADLPLPCPISRHRAASIFSIDMETGALVEDVWQRWLSWDPVRMIDRPEYLAAWRSMKFTLSRLRPVGRKLIHHVGDRASSRTSSRRRASRTISSCFRTAILMCPIAMTCRCRGLSALSWAEFGHFKGC